MQWFDWDDFPRDKPGAYVGWFPKARWGSHYGMIHVGAARNVTMLIIDGVFAWDLDEKDMPSKWQHAPVAPNEQ